MFKMNILKLCFRYIVSKVPVFGFKTEEFDISISIEEDENEIFQN